MPRVEANPNGPRFWVGRLRIHHYHGGLALVALGVYFIAVDRADLAIALHLRATV